MSSAKNVATQTIPTHTVERSSTMCLTSNCLKAAYKITEQTHFTMLKEDFSSIYPLLYGKLFGLNASKENIVLRRLCRPEVWRQFGFSHMEPEVKSKHRQFNKRYWIYASGKQCSPPSFTEDSIVRQPFGTLTQLTFMLNWITSNDDILFSFRFACKQEKALSSEIAAIDMVFCSLMKNLLIDRYPLVFSPGYCDKLQSISQYIPAVSKSLTRIIHNSPNENFQSRMTDLVQKTQNRTKLSFLPHICDNLNTELTQELSTNVLANGLYLIARNIKVPSHSFTESSLSDQGLPDEHLASREAAGSGLIQSQSCTHENEGSQVECGIDIVDEDYEQCFGEINPDIDDEDRGLEDAEFESLFSSDDDFWQDEYSPHLNGTESRMTLRPPEISVNDTDYHKNSDFSDTCVVPDDDDDDLLDFDAFEDDVHFCPNTADSWNLFAPGCREVNNNNVAVNSHVQNLTNELNNTEIATQRQELRMLNNSTTLTLLWKNDPEDELFDAMFE
ncbi:14331_t:CDS:2, partial [Acaulospora colombiana]